MYSNQDPLPLLFPPSSSQLGETETPLHTGTDKNIGLSLPSSSLAFIPRGRTSAFLIPPPRKHRRGQVQAQSLRRTGFLPPRGSASGTVLLRTLEPQESLLGLWHEGSTRGEASQGDLGRLPTPPLTLSTQLLKWGVTQEQVHQSLWDRTENSKLSPKKLTFICNRK